MNRRDLALFVQSAADNKRTVMVHTVAGIVLIGSTLGFSALIALHFGHDVLGLKERPIIGPWAENGLAVLSLAALAALLSMLARIGQNAIEAWATTKRDQWFAEQIRTEPTLRGLGGNLARASNYYGRMAVAAMRAASTVAILIISFLALLLILPSGLLLPAVGAIVLLGLTMYLAMRRLSRAMSEAAGQMLGNAAAASSWKTKPEVPCGDEVRAYFRGYFWRIFLASAFSFVGLAFAFLFAVGLLSLQMLTSFRPNLGEVFVAFTVLQAYLTLVGKFLGSLVHGAAFLPTVRMFLDRSGEASSSVGVVDEVVDDEML
jgi:hypothetical protein